MFQFPFSNGGVLDCEWIADYVCGLHTVHARALCLFLSIYSLHRNSVSTVLREVSRGSQFL